MDTELVVVSCLWRTDGAACQTGGGRGRRTAGVESTARRPRPNDIPVGVVWWGKLASSGFGYNTTTLILEGCIGGVEKSKNGCFRLSRHNLIVRRTSCQAHLGTCFITWPVWPSYMVVSTPFLLPFSALPILVTADHKTYELRLLLQN